MCICECVHVCECVYVCVCRANTINKPSAVYLQLTDRNTGSPSVTLAIGPMLSKLSQTFYNKQLVSTTHASPNATSNLKVCSWGPVLVSIPYTSRSSRSSPEGSRGQVTHHHLLPPSRFHKPMACSTLRFLLLASKLSSVS